MHPLPTVLAAAYGAVAGLLLPRPLYRLSVQPEEPWRGACPRGHRLPGSARGWLGAAWCRECAAGPAGSGAYGVRAPLAAAVTALVCAGLAAAVGARPELAVWALLAPPGLLLAAVDRAVHRLPDVLTLPMAGGTAALLGVGALLPGHAGSWPRALLGGVALGGAYFLLFVVSPGGMGFGDVKLALALGVALGWYGWGVLVAGACAGVLLGGCWAVVLMATRRAGRRSPMAYGPFMIVGAGAGLVLGGLGA
ncbi:A24 family peptidase [Streptomyces sp. B1866]|uniref:prepilin peptidase n=1 Tax=Streptomyces sp. B1866 TaxID=3075431 RepID=UPI00288F6548|nr:A24 family peptidase [Streptomyces sp. B1866]MDT3397028.1 A24 family peptidase [Streptomyces sp. B1866]